MPFFKKLKIQNIIKLCKIKIPKAIFIENFELKLGQMIYNKGSRKYFHNQFNNMDNVLVLGSKGQIGLSLTKILRENKEYNVIECDIACQESHDLRKESDFLNQSFQKADFVYFLAYDVGGSKYLKEKQNSSNFLKNNLL